MPEDKVSIIIPVLNDARALGNLLPDLQPLRAQGHEILVVDGGSADGSMTIARSLADRVLMTGIGRSRQMNLGADYARFEILLFLHADSDFPAGGGDAVLQALANPDRHWGRFDVRLDCAGPVYRLIAAMMNIRSRLSGVATGDQGIFVRKSAFQQVGGFETIPLMEDVALSKSLRKIAWPACLREKLVTSGRRWQQQGVIRTIVLMWSLRLAYFAGVDPEILARRYYPDPGKSRD